MSEDGDSGLLDLLSVPSRRPTGGISQLVVIVLSGTGLLAGALAHLDRHR